MYRDLEGNELPSPTMIGEIKADVAKMDFLKLVKLINSREMNRDQVGIVLERIGAGRLGNASLSSARIYMSDVLGILDGGAAT